MLLKIIFFKSQPENSLYLAKKNICIEMNNVNKKNA